MGIEFSDVSLDDICGGDNLDKCKAAILQSILEITGLKEHRIQNLELTEGNIAYM